MIRFPVCVTAAALLASPATAQTRPSFGVEATNDEVRRGLSWSEGRASASADAQATLGAVEASARVSALRGSTRHAGADAVADLALATSFDLGAVRLRANATAHLFAGARGDMDYAELGASAGYGYGPVQFTAGTSFAPSQSAIGGSNLYLYAGANAGIPGTPFTVLADLGRSSGSVDDPIRAQRLRPGGTYVDWRLGVEHRQGPLTIGLDYIGTDISRRAAFGPFADPRHVGDRIVGRVRFGF